MPVKLKYYLFLICLSNCLFMVGQDRKKDTIDTDVVNVVKPYTPTISDAFKIKETPSLKDSSALEKKPIKYNIFSIPVASTFIPAKGKAATVDKEKPVKLYDNYASLGVGSYATILGEVYLNHELSRDERIGGYLSHHSSRGDVEGVTFDNNFSETGLNAHYTNNQGDFTWKLEGGFNLQTFNWYGVPDQSINTFDVDQSYHTINFGGNINFEDSIIEEGSVLYRRFGDARNSGENRFVLNSAIAVPIKDETITTEFEIDYISGSFEHNYLSETGIDYGNINFSLSPSYQIIEEDLTLNLGVTFTYLNAIEGGGNEFYIYPNITASYRLVDEIMIAFGGIEGGLIQNSYHDFVQINPFVSPTLFILPTDRVYDISAGLKGKLSNSMAYSVSGHYQSDNNRALFKANPALDTNPKNYQFGNSFGVVYDDISTFSIAGELNVDFNRNFKLGLKAQYFTYSTDVEAEAWNLPDIEASAFLDYQIDEHWFAGASVFFVGERKDELSFDENLIETTNTPMTFSINSFVDANAHVGYKINDRLSAFIKGNNLGAQNYNRWLNYPVQGIQFLAGATYQFDF
ncbi:MAG: TonB-dependent receptor [Bacteroidota bacterium]